MKRLAIVLQALVVAAALAAPAASAQSNTRGAWSFVSSGGLHPPSVAVTSQSAGTDPGYIFVAPIKNYSLPGAFMGQPGPLILDSRGNPVWAHPVGGGQVAMDFEPQTYQGRPVLSWWQGKIDPLGFGRGEDVIVDSAYHTVAVVHAGNGYQADLHEFAITPRGTALLTAYKPVRRNLARWGGPGNGWVNDSVVQEVDIKTGRVLFQWDPLSHVSRDDSYTRPYGNTAWDAFHVNSVDEDSRGDLLISARNTWTVYAVNHSNGSLYWRLGGKRSSFKMGPGTGFAYQHDARFGPNGTITVFDNGGAPPVEKQSRGLELTLSGQTAALAVQIDHPKGLLAGSQGSTEVLPDGHFFEGWGAEPYFSEFSSSGQLLFDAHFHGPDQSYRALKAPWTGRVSHGPALVARGGVLYASWNGETDVASWQVLTGPSPSQLNATGSVQSQGFETTARPGGGPYYQVKALDGAGRTLGSSAVVKG